MCCRGLFAVTVFLQFVTALAKSESNAWGELFDDSRPAKHLLHLSPKVFQGTRNNSSSEPESTTAGNTEFSLTTADALGVYDNFEPESIVANGKLAGKWESCRITKSSDQSELEGKNCRIDHDYIDRISFGFKFGHLSDPNQIDHPNVTALNGVARPKIHQFSFDSNNLVGEFSVKYDCGKTEETTILSVMQLTFQISRTQNVTIQWGKLCKSGVNNLLRFGYITASGEKRPFSDVGNDVMLAGPTSAFTDLYLSVVSPAVSQDFLAPKVTSSNESVVTATVRGDAGNGTVTSRRSAKFVIMYACHGHGEAYLEVSVLVPPWSDMSASFKKDCGGGVAKFLSVGTSYGADDVVSHGVTAQKYVPAFFNKLKRLTISLTKPDVPESQHESTFVLQHVGPADSEPIHLSRIVLTVGDQGVLRAMQESYVSMSGYIGKDGGVLRPRESRKLVLHYVCLRAGRSFAVASLPLLRYSTVEFGVVKQCKGPTVHEARSFFNVRAIEDVFLASVLGAVLLLCAVRRVRDMRQQKQGAGSRPEKYERVPASDPEQP